MLIMKFNNLGRVLWSSSSRVIVDNISCETLMLILLGRC